jgi:hypothetical protein
MEVDEGSDIRGGQLKFGGGRGNELNIAVMELNHTLFRWICGTVVAAWTLDRPDATKEKSKNK